MVSVAAMSALALLALPKAAHATSCNVHADDPVHTIYGDMYGSGYIACDSETNLWIQICLQEWSPVTSWLTGSCNRVPYAGTFLTDYVSGDDRQTCDPTWPGWNFRTRASTSYGTVYSNTVTAFCQF